MSRCSTAISSRASTSVRTTRRSGPTCDEAEKEYLYLCKLLGDDDRKHFRNLLDLNLKISGMDSCASFTCGFRYGALLMLEIMDARDALCACP